MIEVRALSRDAFAPFGDVLDVSHPDRFEINDGFTTRVHDRFEPELLGDGPRVLVNFFLGRPRPLEAVKLERHPLGSQAFIPVDQHDLVASTLDAAAVRVFRASGRQGVNYRAGTWHHPLLVDEPHGHRPRRRGQQPGRGCAQDHGALGARLTRSRRLPRLRRCAASPRLLRSGAVVSRTRTRRAREAASPPPG